MTKSEHRQEVCARCRFFDTGTKPDGETPMTICRRRPPTAAFGMVNGNLVWHMVWVQITPLVDWCGEFEQPPRLN